MVSSTADTLARISERLVDALHPQRIYFFGSRAYGTPREDSDLDIAVIMPPNGETRGALLSKAQEALRGLGGSIDVHVFEADRFDRRSGWRANFEHTIRNKGRLIYGEDGMAFAREWMEKALGDLTTAESVLTLSPPLPGISAFHSQQVVEKLLKAFLVHQNVPFEKIHDLYLLCDACAGVDPDFAAWRLRIGELNEYAVRVRYPDEPDPTLQAAQDALAVANQVRALVTSKLPPDTRGGTERA